jgi:hypothetical protein
MPLKVEHKQRSQPYYGKFAYCISFSLPASNCLRLLDHDHINHRFTQLNSSQYYFRKNTEADRLCLHDLCNLLLEYSKDSYKKIISWGYISLYTNDFKMVKKILSASFLKSKHKSVHKADLVLKPGFVLLKNPKFKYRTYLKYCHITEQQRVALKTFFDTNTSDCKPNPKLRETLEHDPKSTVIKNFPTRTWLREWDFLDHNNTSPLLMLNLIYSGICRKTMEIEAK